MAFILPSQEINKLTVRDSFVYAGCHPVFVHVLCSCLCFTGNNISPIEPHMTMSPCPAATPSCFALRQQLSTHAWPGVSWASTNRLTDKSGKFQYTKKF